MSTMKKYIGGEFGRSALKSSPTKFKQIDNSLFFMSGRTAMYAIMQDIILKHSAKSVYIPSYCSRSMIKPIIDSGLDLVFYDIVISENGLTIEYNNSHNCECILLLDYFGFCNEQLLKIASHEKSKGTIVIIDKTQSFLCNRSYNQCANYTLVSFRKWFASSAALAYSSTGFDKKPCNGVNTEYESLRNAGFSTIYNKGFCLDILDNSEDILRSNYKNYSPSDAEIFYIDTLDFVKMRDSRIKNAAVLMDELRGIPQISLIFKKIGEMDCPLYVPIILKNGIDRDFVVSELLKENIESYVHWGFSPYHNESYKNHVLYNQEISLFCDHRYNESDMKRIANSLSKAISTYEAQHETN